MPRCSTAGTSFCLLFVQMLLVAPWQAETSTAARAALNFTRRDFPRDFVFGAGTSAYQYEGAVDEDGGPRASGGNIPCNRPNSCNGATSILVHLIGNQRRASLPPFHEGNFA